jgi:chromosomal replication initiator protein
MKAIWDEIKSQIRTQLPESTFSLWIDPIIFLEKHDKTVVLGCPNKFSRKWVMENYLDIIQAKFHKARVGHFDFVFKADSPKRKTSAPPYIPHPEQQSFPNVPRNGGYGSLCLNKDFTFDRFVVGRSNEFAYSASKALAHGDPWHYQTVLMLSNTGLGKTHLSQAVGHAILQESPKTRVYYLTAENFTNELISSLKNNRIEEFKNKYRRHCDVLLLEEIQFLDGKEKTQIELGYTLDALANDNKKIIFTSSLPPKNIPRISKELSSRLTSGLVTTISGPDYETRGKILEQKASEHGVSLPKEIINLLASRLKRDVRQMESALKCLKAKSELLRAKIDLDLAKDVVNCLASDAYSITLEEIEKLVCKYYTGDVAIQVKKKDFRLPSKHIYLPLPSAYRRIPRKHCQDSKPKSSYCNPCHRNRGTQNEDR